MCSVLRIKLNVKKKTSVVGNVVLTVLYLIFIWNNNLSVIVIATFFLGYTIYLSIMCIFPATSEKSLIYIPCTEFI